MQQLGRASTQYGDMSGTVCIDWHDTGMFHDFFAKHCGVSRGRYFPVAMSAYLGLGDREPFLGLRFYAVDRNVVGSTVEEIAEFATAHGKLPTKQFDGSATLSDFQRFVKRIDIKLTSKQFPDVPIEFEDAED